MKLRSAVSFLFVLFAAPFALAQISTEGGVRGSVKDAQGGALPGVSLTATSPDAPAPFAAVSDGEGTYRFTSLPPGDYTITAELSGFAKLVRTDVQVRAGRNIALDLAMKVGGLEETVQVTADSPLLEVQKATTSVNIDGELQRVLPLTSRKQFADFLEVTPGIVARAGDATGGGQIYFLRGGELENHVIQMDGADMGSFRQNRPDRLLTINTDTVADVQVKTGGVDASSPLGSGAVINVATKTGTDRLKGAVSAIFTPESWNGNNAGAGSVRYNEVFQPDLSLSGPLMKGKVWFFGSYRYTRVNSGIGRTAAQIATLKAVKPDFEPFDNQVRSHNYYLKLTAQLSPKHQVFGFYQQDTHPEGGDREWYAEPLAVTSAGGTGVGARLQSIWGPSVTTKVMASYNNKTTNGSFDVYDGYINDGPAQNVHQSAFISGGRLTGSGVIALLNNDINFFSISPASKSTIQADLTWVPRPFMGSHEVQVGLYYQKLDAMDEERYPNNGFALEELVYRNAANPGAGLIPFHRRTYSVPSMITSDTRASDFAIYVQDAWKPTSRLTLNLGVRLDQVKATAGLFNIELQDAWHFGPRFGATWVATEDGKNVFRASAGRLHEIPMPRNLGSVGVASPTVTDTYDNNLDGVFETTFVTPGSTSASTDRFPDSNHHQPFIDEWTLGFRRQLPGGVAIDTGFSRRKYKDLPALVETNAIYEGSVFKGYRDVNFNNIFSITNNTWNSLVYSGLELNASKRTKRGQILGGYTRGFQHIEGTWQPNDPASFIQPSAFPNNRGIGSIRGNQTNSLGGNADTRSSSWQKHNFRIGGTFTTSFGLLASVSYSYQSGPYSGAIITRIAAADPAFGPATVRLSNGRNVSNPLATTNRFAFPTRGEGQIKLEPLQNLNLKVGYNFKLGGDRKLETTLDVYNATNQGAFEQFLGGGNQTFSPNYGLGRALQVPRVFQLSMRYAF